MEVFLIDRQVQNKQNKEHICLRQTERDNMFHLSVFSKQSVALSVNLFYWFAQTPCPEMLFYLVSFLTQCVNILGELTSLFFEELSELSD